MDLSKEALIQFLQPDENALSFFRRTQVEHLRTGLFLIDENTRLRPGQVVEIAGGTSAGKTELLMEVCSNILLERADPNEMSHYEVLYLDLDGKFDALRLIQMMDARLEEGSSASDSSARLSTALGRFHLLQCHSSVDLVAAVKSLPGLLRGMGGRCALLLLDNVGAFYWMDRAMRGPIGAQPGTRETSGLPLGVVGVHHFLVEALGHITREFRLPVVITRSTTVQVELDKEGTKKLVARDYLPSAWKGLVTGQLVLQCQPAPVTYQGTVPQYQGPPQYCAQWQGYQLGPIQGFNITKRGVVPARWLDPQN